MKYLVLFFLSIEKLLKNPVAWFDTQNWLLRVVVVVLLVPAISVVSIQMNTLFLSKNAPANADEVILRELSDDVRHSNEVYLDELKLLQDDVARIEEKLQMASVLDDSLVLGVEDEVHENLKDRVAGFDPAVLEDAETDLVYIKSDIDTVVMYYEPSSDSTEFTDFELGAFYPALSRKSYWQEIDLGNGQTAWVDKEFIIYFPTDENR